MEMKSRLCPLLIQQEGRMWNIAKATPLIIPQAIARTLRQKNKRGDVVTKLPKRAAALHQLAATTTQKLLLVVFQTKALKVLSPIHLSVSETRFSSLCQEINNKMGSSSTHWPQKDSSLLMGKNNIWGLLHKIIKVNLILWCLRDHKPHRWNHSLVEVILCNKIIEDCSHLICLKSNNLFILTSPNPYQTLTPLSLSNQQFVTSFPSLNLGSHPQYQPLQALYLKTNHNQSPWMPLHRTTSFPSFHSPPPWSPGSNQGPNQGNSNL